MRKALALIAYTRLEYLQSVWASIQSQTIAGHALSQTYDIYVCQDGLWAGEAAAGRTGHYNVRKWLDQLPSRVVVLKQTENLGIAVHYDFIEKLLFVENSYDFVVLCEDDLVLAPGYMSVIDRMADKFHDDRRVGMVSAHPGDPTVPIELQHAHKDRWAPMGHNWAYGISRSFWKRRQPLIECYLDLIRKVPYRYRNEQLIFKWLERIGFRPFASSQDYVRTCATYALGAVKLSTYPNFGRPIGRSGVHCTPALFKRMGFDRTVVFDDQLDAIGDLSDDTHRDLWQQMIHQVEARNVQVIADPEGHDVDAWETRLATGDFHPSRVIPDVLAATCASDRAALPRQHHGPAYATSSGAANVSRTVRCPCGSGKRYKRCHGRLT
ncbi:MAG: SEC-C domain-containing protein [Acidipila sp.]|nr:SEC-C domain-containing protein [Acidipila sp.]